MEGELQHTGELFTGLASESDCFSPLLTHTHKHTHRRNVQKMRRRTSRLVAIKIIVVSQGVIIQL